MDITKRLEGCLYNSCLFHERVKASKDLDEYFQKLGKRLLEYEKLALVCDAKAANRFILKTGIGERVSVILEAGNGAFHASRWLTQVYGIDVAPYEEACRHKDCLFVALDDKNGKELFNSVYFHAKKILNVPDDIKDKGEPLFLSYSEWMAAYNTPFEKIMLDRRKYEAETDIRKKKKYLINLIYDLLQIKDFHSSYQYIDRYMESGFDQNGEMEKFRNGIDRLLADISYALKQRDGRNDIIMIWNDGLRYDELKEMPYLGKEFANDSFCMDHAFSTVYDSEGSLGSMFQKKYQVDDFHVNEGESYSSINSPVIKLIESHGYRFKMIFHFYLADREHTDLIDSFVAGSEKMWLCIQNLLDAKEPMFFLLQENTETHNPYHSPYLDKDYYFINNCTPSQYQNQIRISRSYWDSQIKFYMRLLDYDNMKIVMSDHGKPMTLQDLCVLDWGYLSDYLHIVLMVNGKNIKPGNEKRLFSAYYFKELLEYIFEPSKEGLEKCFPQEYVKIQSIDRYDPFDIERKLKAGADKRHLMSYRGIRTLDDMYVRIANGEERYFKLPDERTNRICDDKYKDRIEELKEQNAGNFLDIETIPFFHASLQLYKDR